MYIALALTNARPRISIQFGQYHTVSAWTLYLKEIKKK